MNYFDGLDFQIIIPSAFTGAYDADSLSPPRNYALRHEHLPVYLVMRRVATTSVLVSTPRSDVTSQQPTPFVEPTSTTSYLVDSCSKLLDDLRFHASFGCSASEVITGNRIRRPLYVHHHCSMPTLDLVLGNDMCEHPHRIVKSSDDIVVILLLVEAHITDNLLERDDTYLELLVKQSHTGITHMISNDQAMPRHGSSMNIDVDNARKRAGKLSSVTLRQNLRFVFPFKCEAYMHRDRDDSRMFEICLDLEPSGCVPEPVISFHGCDVDLKNVYAGSAALDVSGQMAASYYCNTKPNDEQDVVIKGSSSTSFVVMMYRVGDDYAMFSSNPRVTVNCSLYWTASCMPKGCSQTIDFPVEISLPQPPAVSFTSRLLNVSGDNTKFHISFSFDYNTKRPNNLVVINTQSPDILGHLGRSVPTATNPKLGLETQSIFDYVSGNTAPSRSSGPGVSMTTLIRNQGPSRPSPLGATDIASLMVHEVNGVGTNAGSEAMAMEFLAIRGHARNSSVSSAYSSPQSMAQSQSIAMSGPVTEMMDDEHRSKLWRWTRKKRDDDAQSAGPGAGVGPRHSRDRSSSLAFPSELDSVPEQSIAKSSTTFVDLGAGVDDTLLLSFDVMNLPSDLNTIEFYGISRSSGFQKIPPLCLMNADNGEYVMLNSRQVFST